MDKAPDAYRTISEVAEDLDLPQHVLRFWETRFPQIKPLKRGGGRRYYRPDDVELLNGIRHLLYKEGYTIKGVQRILREQGHRAVANAGKEGGLDWPAEERAAQPAAGPGPAIPTMAPPMPAVSALRPTPLAAPPIMVPPLSESDDLPWGGELPDKTGASDDDVPWDDDDPVEAFDTPSPRIEPRFGAPAQRPLSREPSAPRPAEAVPNPHVSMFRGGLVRPSTGAGQEALPLDEPAPAAGIAPVASAPSSAAPANAISASPVPGAPRFAPDPPLLAPQPVVMPSAASGETLRDAMREALDELKFCRAALAQLMASNRAS